MDNWVVLVLQSAFWLAAMTLIMGWVSKSRTRVVVGMDENLLRNPKSILIVGFVTFAFFVTLEVLSSVVFENGTASVFTHIVFVGFAILGIYIVAEYFVESYRLTEDGIEFQNLFRPKGRIAWVEINSVTYSHGMKWFRLSTTRGQAVRISATLVGLPNFARNLLQKAPAGSIGEFEKALLDETSKGNPPSIWQ